MKNSTTTGKMVKAKHSPRSSLLLLDTASPETIPNQGSRVLIIQQTCRSSFSAESKPNFANEYLLWRILENLHSLHTFATFQTQHLRNLQNLQYLSLFPKNHWICTIWRKNLVKFRSVGDLSARFSHNLNIIAGNSRKLSEVSEFCQKLPEILERTAGLHRSMQLHEVVSAKLQFRRLRILAEVIGPGFVRKP